MKKRSKNEIQKCKTCGNGFFSRFKRSYCSDKCSPGHISKIRIKTELDFLSTTSKGTYSELIVACDLIKKGFEVFRSLNSGSYVDMIATKNGKIYLLEIRTAQYFKTNKETRLSFPAKRTKGKILILVTYSDNKIHYPENF